MKDKLNQLFSGCMAGRTMYIVPFCMGPVNSRYKSINILNIIIVPSLNLFFLLINDRWRKIGVFATDSLYAVTFISLSMQVGTHVCTFKYISLLLGRCV